MKKLLSVVLAVCLLASPFSLLACGENEEESLVLTATGNVTELQPGQSVQLSTNLSGEVEYEITQGETAATISDDAKLTVKTDAAIGTVIKTVAKLGEKTSNELSFDVIAIPLVSIAADSSRSIIAPGGSANLTYTLTPANATQNTVTWEFKQGADKATIADNVITVKADTAVGTEIKLVAKCGTIESNVITVLVNDIPLVSIAAKLDGEARPEGEPLELMPGDTATLSYVLNPTNTTQYDVDWQISNSYGWATIADNVLTIGSNAQSGTIEIQAKRGTILSNTLFVSVVLPSEIYFIEADSSITVQKNATSANPTLTASLTDIDGDPVTDANVEISFEILTGSEFISINPTGNNCAITPLGHGDATISIKIDGVHKFTTTVSSKMAPSRIDLPGYLSDKSGKRYAVGKDQAFDFVATAPSDENACQDIVYTFEDITPTPPPAEPSSPLRSDEPAPVATYENGKITFNQTGTIRVTARSNSGDASEATTTRIFEVNNGTNVSTWEEARTILMASNYDSQPINFIVTQIPQGYVNYDIVPAVTRLASPSYTDVGNAIISVSTSTIINGNNHVVNFSKLNPMLDNYTNRYSAAIGITNAESDFTAEINDLAIYGNVTIDGKYTSTGGDVNYDSNNAKLIGVIGYGIRVEGRVNNVTNDTKTATAILNNVEVRNFHSGAVFSGLKDGSEINNLTVGDVYLNGVETNESIATFRNFTIGACGATGIELSPDHNNSLQDITFTGALSGGNTNNGDTAYLSRYRFGTFTITDVITGILAAIPSSQQSTIHPHFINSSGQFMFVIFIFSDLPAQNASNVTIEGYNIITLENLLSANETNTNTPFIQIDIPASLVGAPGTLGTIIVRNWLYEAPSAPTA